MTLTATETQTRHQKIGAERSSLHALTEGLQRSAQGKSGDGSILGTESRVCKGTEVTKSLMYLELKYNGEMQRRAGRDQNMQRAWKDTSQSRRLHEDRLACTVAAPTRSRESVLGELTPQPSTLICFPPICQRACLSRKSARSS